MVVSRSRLFSVAAARRPRGGNVLRRGRIGTLGVAAAFALGLALATTGSAVAGSPQAAAPAVQGFGNPPVPPGSGLAVDWALAGQASADTSGTSTPASNAIDGDAGTDWCPTQWEGYLTIDLGQVRSLSDLGITMDATDVAADASIELASTSTAWATLPTARNLALDAGQPMYLPLP